jgi:hypothetical protein
MLQLKDIAVEKYININVYNIKYRGSIYYGIHFNITDLL